MKKDIFIISSEFPPQPGGIGNHAYNLASYLSSKGLKVTVLADNRSASGKEEAIFDSACDFQVVRTRVTSPRVFMYFIRLIKTLKYLKNHQKLIVSGKFPIWLGALTTPFFSGTKMAVVHGTEVNFKNKWLKKSIDKALGGYDIIIAVSRHTKSLLTPKNQEKCKVISNGFDPLKFDLPGVLANKMFGELKLVTVGNVTHRKGQLNVIRHLPGLLQVFPGLHYHMVGLPTYKDEFLEEAKKLKIADKITFHGVLSDANLKACLLESTIFVMLSNETASGDIEGFGIAVLEANYLGIPAIGSRGCGIEDAILDGKSGHLIDFDDEKAFIIAIKEILKNKESYKVEAIQWGNKHRWEIIIQNYLKELSL